MVALKIQAIGLMRLILCFSLLVGSHQAILASDAGSVQVSHSYERKEISQVETSLKDLVAARQAFMNLRSDTSERLRSIRYQLRYSVYQLAELNKQIRMVETQGDDQTLLSIRMQNHVSTLSRERAELEEFRQQLIRKLSDLEIDISQLNKKIRTLRKQLKT